MTEFANRAGIQLRPRALFPPATIADVRAGPIVVSGFFSDTRGIAQGARLSVAALRAAGFTVIAHDISYLLSGTTRTPGPPGVEGGVWLIHCNPPEADQVLRGHPELARRPLFRIGYWAWELPRAPVHWLSLASAFHEVWVPSAFTAASFAGAETSVCVMPHPVCLSTAPPLARNSDTSVNFLCVADLRSSIARKNPDGAIRAFRMAFPRPAAARMTVKLSGVDDHPDALAALCALVADRNDIRLITERLESKQMLDLYAECDVLVSLHRSEGFGLPIAESMAAGRAVIATAWSGNLDFMPQIDIQLIPGSLREVEDSSGLYQGQFWADPDLSLAAAAMRALTEDPALRRRCGQANERAIAKIRASWSFDALNGLTFAHYATLRA